MKEAQKLPFPYTILGGTIIWDILAHKEIDERLIIRLVYVWMGKGTKTNLKTLQTPSHNGLVGK